MFLYILYTLRIDEKVGVTFYKNCIFLLVFVLYFLIYILILKLSLPIIFINGYKSTLLKLENIIDSK